MAAGGAAAVGIGKTARKTTGCGRIGGRTPLIYIMTDAAGLNSPGSIAMRGIIIAGIVIAALPVCRMRARSRMAVCG